MHELSIARALVTSVRRHLPAGDHAIRAVNVIVGGATGIVPEALELAFRAASQGTPLEDAVLRIEQRAGSACCGGCGDVFSFEGLLGSCPRCGELGGTLVGGRELELHSIEVVDV